MKPGQSLCPGCGLSYYHNQKWIHERCLDSKQAKETSTNDGSPLVANVNDSVSDTLVSDTRKTRQKAWRDKHRDDYNKKQRELMKIRRAKTKS